MSSTIPRAVACVTDQPQISLVYQRRCLKRLTGTFIRQTMGRQPSKFLVYQRQKLGRCARVPICDGAQNFGDLVHGLQDTTANESGWLRELATSPPFESTAF